MAWNEKGMVSSPNIPVSLAEKNTCHIVTRIKIHHTFVIIVNMPLFNILPAVCMICHNDEITLSNGNLFIPTSLVKPSGGTSRPVTRRFLVRLPAERKTHFLMPGIHSFTNERWQVYR